MRDPNEIVFLAIACGVRHTVLLDAEVAAVSPI